MNAYWNPSIVPLMSPPLDEMLKTPPVAVALPGVLMPALFHPPGKPSGVVADAAPSVPLLPAVVVGAHAVERLGAAGDGDVGERRVVGRRRADLLPAVDAVGAALNFEAAHRRPHHSS